MKHQYKERLAGVRKIALLPLCIGVLALFSFTENPVLVEPVLPMVSVTIKAETPKVVLPEVTVDSAGNEKDFFIAGYSKDSSLCTIKGCSHRSIRGRTAACASLNFCTEGSGYTFGRELGWNFFTGAKYKSYRGYRFTG